MDSEKPGAGDPAPGNSELIEVHVAELKQLFNAMDASPFRERDLDPDAEEFIVGWAREASRRAKLILLVRLDRGPGLAEEPAALQEAIHRFFTRRAQAARRRLSQLLGIGRFSLLIGLAFLTAAVALGDLVARAIQGQRTGELLRMGLVICGWVAMWRPLEILLYGWWPIRREARLYERLSAMPVRIAYRGSAEPEAWRLDWPAAPPRQAMPQQSQPRSSSPRGSSGGLAGAPAVPERGPVAEASVGDVAAKLEPQTSDRRRQ